MSMCKVFSCVVRRGCLLGPVRCLDKTLSLCPASFCTTRPNLLVTPGIFWLPTFAFQSPIMKRISFLCVSLELFNFSFFSITGLGIDLDYHGSECFALETDKNHSVVFEIVPHTCVRFYHIQRHYTSNFYQPYPQSIFLMNPPFSISIF